MKTFILVIPVNCKGIVDSRQTCNLLEHNVYELGNNPFPMKVLQAVNDDLGVEQSDIEVYPISDFMEKINDDQINFDDSYITYVYA